MAEITGLSHKEIADALSLTVANVKVRIHRARIQLKKQLGEEDIVKVEDDGHKDLSG
jgi:DNA-directed RNA polymerase specialized sigma24 family protein